MVNSRPQPLDSSAPRSFVVTGGGSGIGRVVAARLALDGLVVVVDRQSPPFSTPPLPRSSR